MPDSSLIGDDDADPALAILSANPAVMGGRIVFAGTRVPVEVVFENLADGLSVDEIVDSYPTLDKGQVVALLEDAAKRYARRP